MASKTKTHLKAIFESSQHKFNKDADNSLIPVVGHVITDETIGSLQVILFEFKYFYFIVEIKCCIALYRRCVFKLEKLSP